MDAKYRLVRRSIRRGRVVYRLGGRARYEINRRKGCISVSFLLTERANKLDIIRTFQRRRIISERVGWGTKEVEDLIIKGT